ncbi:MAG TPA: hypothetical protein VME46_17295 [Acidimicrobiales bacterium]|nr:hypothetical protein [Acidimicrobiales bacterium]
MSLRRHDAATVRQLALEFVGLAGALGFPEYEGVAAALLCWVAWQEGRSDEVEKMAQEALAHWGRCVVHYSFHWLALWPLVAVHLSGGRVADAVEVSRQMLLPPQQRLPEELELAIQAALGTWDKCDSQGAAEMLGQAVELACRLRYA